MKLGLLIFAQLLPIFSQNVSLFFIPFVHKQILTKNLLTPLSSSIIETEDVDLAVAAQREFNKGVLGKGRLHRVQVAFSGPRKRRTG